MEAEDTAPISPSKSADRILDIDILRGFALFGVILVNIFYFHVPAAYFSTYYEQFSDFLNREGYEMVNWFFTGKFYPILSFLFYSFGLGLYASLTPIYLPTIAVVLFFVYLAAGILWLKYFQYGPLEWIWRSLTYNKVVPLRKRAT